MRNLLVVAMAVVGLAAAPALAVVHASLSVDDPDSTLLVGESTTVRLFVSAVGEPANGGVMSVAVDILADVGGVILSTVPVTFNEPPFDVDALPIYGPGTAGPNGGVQDAAVSVPVFPPVRDVGLAGPVEVFNFQVTAVGVGVVTLTIDNQDIFGYRGIVTWGQVFGDDSTYDGATITVIPEPASLALLGMGGLALLRRRFA